MSDLLLEKKLDIPEAAHEVARPFFKEGFDPTIKITITKKSIQKATEIADLLTKMRQITKPSRVSDNHMLVMLINAQEGNKRPVSEITQQVADTCADWEEEARSDGSKLALTQLTQLNMNMTPEPYAPQDFTPAFENDWEEAAPMLPEPTRHLENIYEKRLKLFNDMLAAVGTVEPAFPIMVINELNASMTELVGKFGRGPIDDAGFPAGGLDLDVHGPAVAGARTNGKRQKNLG